MLVFKNYPSPEAYNLSEEFHTSLDPLARFAVEDLAAALDKQFGIPLTVTCVLRTPDENAAVGGIQKSAHIPGPDGFGRAVDLRLLPDPKAEAFILAYVALRWGPVVHFIRHNAGTGPHYHMNVNYQYSRHQAMTKAAV